VAEREEDEEMPDQTSDVEVASTMSEESLSTGEEEEDEDTSPFSSSEEDDEDTDNEPRLNETDDEGV
jgi:hypothetical protein